MRHIGRLLGLGLVIGLLGGSEIWRTYRHTTTGAERSAAALAHLLAEQTERTIQAIDFTLIGLRDALHVAPELGQDDPAYRAAMVKRLGHLPYVRGLFVVGADGFITHDTDYPRTPRVNLADRPYFQLHRDHPEVGLHISQPLRSRSVDNWFVGLSRRVNKPDGSFAGIVLAAVEPRYFKRFYEDLSISEDTLIALLLRDGTLLARMPDHEETIGRSYAGSPLRELALERGSGVATATSPVDQVTRIVGYRMLARGSLIVMVGWPLHEIYDGWVEHAAVVSVSSILVWLLASGFTWLWIKSRVREQRESARLGQARRLEMMGRIAGGVAHDLGNTIRIARTTFTLLRPSLGSQREAMALVDDADRSLKSAFDIIDRLLAFARRQELSPRATDLGPLIAGFAPILRQAAGPRVELGLDLNGGRSLVSVVDPIHLESALLNLVLNSKDAMPDGGCIVITLREAEAPGKRRREAPAPVWAEIAVRDTGTGMSRHVLERALEPFFTTRIGGSGLGLSQVLGFVQQSAGDVRIESRQGVGTTVRLLFPTTTIAPDAPRPAVAAEPAGPS